MSRREDEIVSLIVVSAMVFPAAVVTHFAFLFWACGLSLGGAIALLTEPRDR